MILPILITILGILWIGYETNWQYRIILTPKYPIGDCCQWRLQDNQVDNIAKANLMKMWKLNGSYSGGHLEPLCGWGFAYQYRYFMPEYKVELIEPHARYTLATNNTEILRDCFRVYRNPNLKVRLQTNAKARAQQEMYSSHRGGHS